MLTQLPLNEDKTLFASVEMPELLSQFVSANSGRKGKVISLSTKLTKSGYGVLVIEFTPKGQTKSQWATISPVA
jgi:hypothetical protein